MLSAGLLGWPFALVFFVGTIAIGLAAGGLTAVIERSGWLHDQARVRAAGPRGAETCGTGLASGPGTVSAGQLGLSRLRLAELAP